MNSDAIIFSYYMNNDNFKKVNGFNHVNTMDDDGFLWLHLDGKNIDTNNVKIRTNRLFFRHHPSPIMKNPINKIVKAK